MTIIVDPKRLYSHQWSTFFLESTIFIYNHDEFEDSMMFESDLFHMGTFDISSFMNYDGVFSSMQVTR